MAARTTATPKIPDARAQQSLRTSVLEAFSASRLNEWQLRLEAIPAPAVFDRPLDLVPEFIEPWCLAAAEIVTASRAADRQRLLDAARIVSQAAAEPLDEELHARSVAASAELDSYFEPIAIPMAGPTFVALARTVASLLASGWLALFRHPAELARLRQQPELASRAVEEILRYACLPQSVFRRASKSLILCGQQMEEGDRVILQLAAANRDPEHFTNPETFVVGRRGPAHLSLGIGPHACVGAALIRMTATAATRVFLEQFAGADLLGPVTWQGGNGFRSPASLPIRPGC
ncbi:MAG TPA: cytochrome P450 [Bryobacteraceae bacterium]|nr:cytochrome P450 [Bryobacteraceae bacterium]